MLRQPRLVPNISAYAHLYGPQYYNSEPLAQLAFAVDMHVKPEHRDTFASHLVSGFYIGTYQEQYRFQKVWVKYNKSVSIGDNLFFKHKYLTNRTIMDSDAIIQAGYNIEIALDKNIPQTY